MPAPDDPARPTGRAGAPDPVDGVALASLLTGVLGVRPFALVLGVLGLRRTRPGGLGHGLALAGTALGGLGTLLAAAGVAGLLALGAGTGLAVLTTLPGGPAAPGGVTGSSDLRVGDCYQDGEDADGWRVDVVDCDDPHDAEVVTSFTTDLDGGPAGGAPEEDALAQEADERCADAVSDLLQGAGLRTGAYSPGSFVPSESTWADGDRTTLCTLYLLDPDDDLTGSLVAGTLRAEEDAPVL